MHKVIVEEPRHGGGRTKMNRRANLPDELLPKCEGMRRPYRCPKRFGEHLGPLKRWLRSNVGRPWNAVYGEASEVIKPDNPVRAHIRTHLLQCVQRNTFMRDGRVWCHRGGWGSQAECAIEDSQSRWCLFYVHPETGVLSEIPERPRRRGTVSNRDPNNEWVSETTLLRRIHGCWFECQMVPFADRPVKGESPWTYDHIRTGLICRSQARADYGRTAYCVAKRQLSWKELKQRGLKTERALRRSLNSVSRPGRFC